MKKIISLILSIALLATLMPTILVSAEESTQRFDITQDAALKAVNKNEDGTSTSYGGGTWSNAASALLRSVSTSTEALLYKADFGSFDIPDGKAVTKVELNLAIVPSANNGGSSMTIGAYHVTGSYDMSTVTMKSFVGEDSPLSPKLEFPNSDNNVYGYTTAEPDSKAVVTCSSFPTDSDCIPFKIDVTNIFKKQFPTGKIGDNKDMSIALFCRETGGWGLRYEVAFSEHEIEAARPYITLTLDDVPEFAEVSYTLPEMINDDFSLTVSNNIESAEVVVNGTPLEESQYTVNGGTLSLNYTYAGLTDYSVAVNITDVYDQNFVKTYTFTTRDENGADASGVIKRYIVDDTYISAESKGGGYGLGNYSTSDAVLLRSASTATNAALMRVDLSGLTIPVGKAITNVTLHLGVVDNTTYDTNVSSIPVMAYLVTGDYNTSTVCTKDFVAPTTYTPVLEFPNSSNSVYGWPTGTPDVAGTLSNLSSGHTTLDITNIFNKKFANGYVENEDVAFMIHKSSTGYGSNCYIALSEYADAQYRPYITITVDDKKAESQTASEFYHYSYSGQIATEITGNKYIYKAEVKDSDTAKINNSVVMARFTLTKDHYDSFVVNYAPNTADSQKYQRFYKFYNEDNKAGSALTYADFNDEIYDDTMLIGGIAGDGSIDVADYANECVANGKDYMCLIISAQHGCTTSIKNTVPTANAVMLLVPSITLSGSTLAVAGSYIKSIDAKFTTVLANSAAAKVELYKGATKVEDVTFVSKGNTIDFAAPTKLEENTSYTVVLKAGATDLFGNTTTEDIEIAAFTTGVDFVNHGIKLFAKDTEVEKDAFATTDGLTAATVGTEIQGYWRADNNAIEEKALIIAIGAYDDNNELLGVQFSAFDANDEETKIYKTNVLTVPTGATKIKAFGWDGTSQAGIAFAEISVQ